MPPNDILGALHGGISEVFPEVLYIRHLFKRGEVVEQFQGERICGGGVFELLDHERIPWYGLPLVTELELDIRID